MAVHEQSENRVIFDTAQEAMDELVLRVMLLKSAPVIMKKAVWGIAEDSMRSVQRLARDERHRAHNEYADSIVLEDIDGAYHVYVLAADADKALAAEIGDEVQPGQGLWSPAYRGLEASAEGALKGDMAKIAHSVEIGEE